MEDLIREVQTVVDNECSRAAEKYGKVNNSNHESYAVILEELEEAGDEFDDSRLALQDFWEMVKADRVKAFPEDALRDLRSLEKHAVLCACEMIQVAGVARKAERTVFRDSKK